MVNKTELKTLYLLQYDILKNRILTSEQESKIRSLHLDDHPYELLPLSLAEYISILENEDHSSISSSIQNQQHSSRLGSEVFNASSKRNIFCLDNSHVSWIKKIPDESVFSEFDINIKAKSIIETIFGEEYKITSSKDAQSISVKTRTTGIGNGISQRSNNKEIEIMKLGWGKIASDYFFFLNEKFSAFESLICMINSSNNNNNEEQKSFLSLSINKFVDGYTKFPSIVVTKDQISDTKFKNYMTEAGFSKLTIEGNSKQIWSMEDHTLATSISGYYKRITHLGAFSTNRSRPSSSTTKTVTIPKNTEPKSIVLHLKGKRTIQREKEAAEASEKLKKQLQHDLEYSLQPPLVTRVPAPRLNKVVDEKNIPMFMDFASSMWNAQASARDHLDELTQQLWIFMHKANFGDNRISKVKYIVMMLYQYADKLETEYQDPNSIMGRTIYQEMTRLHEKLKITIREGMMESSSIPMDVIEEKMPLKASSEAIQNLLDEKVLDLIDRLDRAVDADPKKAKRDFGFVDANETRNNNNNNNNRSETESERIIREAEEKRCADSKVVDYASMKASEFSRSFQENYNIQFVEPLKKIQDRQSRAEEYMAKCIVKVEEKIKACKNINVVIPLFFNIISLSLAGIGMYWKWGAAPSDVVFSTQDKIDNSDTFVDAFHKNMINTLDTIKQPGTIINGRTEAEHINEQVKTLHTIVMTKVEDAPKVKSDAEKAIKDLNRQIAIDTNAIIKNSIDYENNVDELAEMCNKSVEEACKKRDESAENSSVVAKLLSAITLSGSQVTSCYPTEGIKSSKKTLYSLGDYKYDPKRLPNMEREKLILETAADMIGDAKENGNDLFTDVKVAKDRSSFLLENHIGIMDAVKIKKNAHSMHKDYKEFTNECNGKLLDMLDSQFEQTAKNVKAWDSSIKNNINLMENFEKTANAASQTILIQKTVSDSTEFIMNSFGEDKSMLKTMLPERITALMNPGLESKMQYARLVETNRFLQQKYWSTAAYSRSLLRRIIGDNILAEIIWHIMGGPYLENADSLLNLFFGTIGSFRAKGFENTTWTEWLKHAGTFTSFGALVNIMTFGGIISNIASIFLPEPFEMARTLGSYAMENYRSLMSKIQGKYDDKGTAPEDISYFKTIFNLLGYGTGSIIVGISSLVLDTGRWLFGFLDAHKCTILMVAFTALLFTNVVTIGSIFLNESLLSVGPSIGNLLAVRAAEMGPSIFLGWVVNKFLKRNTILWELFKCPKSDFNQLKNFLYTRTSVQTSAKALLNASSGWQMEAARVMDMQLSKEDEKLQVTKMILHHVGGFAMMSVCGYLAGMGFSYASFWSTGMLLRWLTHFGIGYTINMDITDSNRHLLTKIDPRFRSKEEVKSVKIVDAQDTYDIVYLNTFGKMRDNIYEALERQKSRENNELSAKEVMNLFWDNLPSIKKIFPESDGEGKNEL
jgi:hypothetical protein